MVTSEISGYFQKSQEKAQKKLDKLVSIDYSDIADNSDISENE
jgi:hypothetical protein